MGCKNCQGLCAKKGCQGRKQRYCCKTCGLYQLKTYKNKFCSKEDEKMIVKLNNEGMSISGIARITGISKSNVIRKIKQIANTLSGAVVHETGQEYEVDEIHTFIGSKSNSCYNIYALNKATRGIIDFVIGGRTKENIGKVIDKIKELNPKRIYTDKLNIYPALIEKSIHTASSYKINHIERFNLTLRTHLKRLNRKTICFLKNSQMLENCLKMYLYNRNSA